MTQSPKGNIPETHSGAVHCPMCTHNVYANLVHADRRLIVQPGQKCPRCMASLDAAYILRMDRAA